MARGKRFVPYYVEVGERVIIECPYSEVCMHMRVAGRRMGAELQPSGWSVQLFTLDGQPYSAPITTGEAGFYHDQGKIYTYLAEGASDDTEAEVSNA